MSMHAKTCSTNPTILTLTLVLLAFVSMPALADGHGEMGYVVDPSGKVYKNSFGECWRDSFPSPDNAKYAEQCGDAPAPLDTDGDGVTDDKDQCPNTPKGAPVNGVGCPLDSDGDGVYDYMDKCPGTPKGARVNAEGCEIIQNITIDLDNDEFDFDSAELKPAMKAALDDVAQKLMNSQGDERVEVVGHTDSVGAAEYNQALSLRRAQATADYLASKGIDRAMMSVLGEGETKPIADNGTDEGRSKNRRVEINAQ